MIMDIQAVLAKGPIRASLEDPLISGATDINYKRRLLRGDKWAGHIAWRDYWRVYQIALSCHDFAVAQRMRRALVIEGGRQ